MNRAQKIVHGHGQVNMKRNVFGLAIEFFKVLVSEPVPLWTSV